MLRLLPLLCGKVGVAYLVWSVAYADVKIWELCFDNIPKHDFQTFLLWFALHTFRNLRSHAGIQLYRDHFLRFLKNLHRKISSTRANFKHDLEQISLVASPQEDLMEEIYIALLQIGFLNNSLSHSRVL